jgi:chromosome segregation ATPase
MFDQNMHIDVSELLEFDEGDIKFGPPEDSAVKPDAGNSHQAARTECAPEFDAQADVLRGLLQEFKSLTNRACETAVREAQHSAHIEELAGIEVVTLKQQLKDKTEALAFQNKEFQERNAIAGSKIDSLEIQLREKAAQLENCQTRSQGLLGEIDGLNLRLNEAASAIKQAETRFRDFADHQQSKINALRDEVKAKDDALQAKDAELKQLDETLRATVGDLERQLEMARANLDAKEITLREKDAALQAAASREQAITQLFQQLAAESQRLMNELREKNQLVSEMENRTYRSFDNIVASTQGTTVQ